MKFLLLDRCQSVWRRLTTRHETIINFPQDLPADWELDLEESDILEWLEYLDDPIVQINCADHLDRCLAHDHQQS